MPRTTASTDWERMGELHLALYDPLRLQILAFLRASGGAFVNDVIAHLGEPQSTVSRKLGDLRNFGLVVAERQGLGVRYTLSPVYEQLLPDLDSLQTKWKGSAYGTVTQSRARRGFR